MRIAVCGYGEHGKDTVSHMLSEMLGLKYAVSTSEAAAQVVFQLWGRHNGYDTAQDCWDDRREHRVRWANIIWDYNQPDGLTLYREMISDNDILNGIRRRNELVACVAAGLVHHSVWVDASKRLSAEPSASCVLSADDCDFVLDNNGDQDDLYNNVVSLTDKLICASDKANRK